MLIFHLYMNLHLLTAANTVSDGQWPTILKFPFPLRGPRLTALNLFPCSVKLHCVSVGDDATACAQASTCSEELHVAVIGD